MISLWTLSCCIFRFSSTFSHQLILLIEFYWIIFFVVFKRLLRVIGVLYWTQSTVLFIHIVATLFVLLGDFVFAKQHIHQILFKPNSDRLVLKFLCFISSFPIGSWELWFLLCLTMRALLLITVLWVCPCVYTFWILMLALYGLAVFVNNKK